MSSQPLLFNVESIYDMRNELVEQSVAIIKSAVVMYPSCPLLISEIGDAIENDRLERYVIHSAEDYFGAIARYQLLDEAPTVGVFDGVQHRSTLISASSRAQCRPSCSASPIPSRSSRVCVRALASLRTTPSYSMYATLPCSH